MQTAKPFPTVEARGSDSQTSDTNHPLKIQCNPTAGRRERQKQLPRLRPAERFQEEKRNLAGRLDKFFFFSFVVLSIPALRCCSGYRLASSGAAGPKWTRSRAALVRRRLQERINVKPKGAASWWLLIQHLSGAQLGPGILLDPVRAAVGPI